VVADVVRDDLERAQRATSNQTLGVLIALSRDQYAFSCK
jgi:hypothetical protein